jgi:N-acetylglucosamine kinase-like BadF-type ATPase
VPAARYLLAVDGGNTSTIALVFDLAEGLVGVAQGGCGDIYGARSPGEAINEVIRTSKAALEDADVAVPDVDIAAFGLAGADWPEDFRLLEDDLGSALPPRGPLLVVNDAVGALWTGTDDGRGVGAAIGTYASVAGSGPAGTWHSSFWSEPAGAVHLAEAALRMACRAELETGPSTALRERMLAAGGFSRTEEMLHHYTSRERPPRAAIAGFAPLILDVAEEGDEVARQLVRQQGEAVSRSVRAAVRQAGLTEPYRMVLTGGLFNHDSSLMLNALREQLPSSRPIVTRVEPAAGVALMAAHAVGIDIDREATFADVDARLLGSKPCRHRGNQEHLNAV